MAGPDHVQQLLGRLLLQDLLEQIVEPVIEDWGGDWEELSAGSNPVASPRVEAVRAIHVV